MSYGEAGGDDQSRASVVVAEFVDNFEITVFRNAGRAGAILDLEIEATRKVAEIPDKVARRREETLAVAFEQHLFVVAQQRVPIPAQVDLRVFVAGVNFIVRDQLPVSRKSFEESAGGVARLQYQVVPPRPLEKVAELQTRRACADDDVTMVYGRSVAFVFHIPPLNSHTCSKLAVGLPPRSTPIRLSGGRLFSGRVTCESSR